jgi:hypothetical protein
MAPSALYASCPDQCGRSSDTKEPIMSLAPSRSSSGSRTTCARVYSSTSVSVLARQLSARHFVSISTAGACTSWTSLVSHARRLSCSPLSGVPQIPGEWVIEARLVTALKTVRSKLAQIEAENSVPLDVYSR